jgi:hypothetical protein
LTGSRNSEEIAEKLGSLGGRRQLILDVETDKALREAFCRWGRPSGLGRLRRDDPRGKYDDETKEERSDD